MAKYMGRLLTAFTSALEFNSATLSGAIDIIVIEDERGIRRCSPFHVRFGKLQLLKSRGIPVAVELNGKSTKLRLYLGPAGEAYFYCPLRDKDLRSTDAIEGGELRSSSANSAESPRATEPCNGRPTADVDVPQNERDDTLYNVRHPKSPPAVLSSPVSANLVKVASAPIPEDYAPVHTGALVTSRLEATSSPLIMVPTVDACGYVSDSEVEVSRNERDGTAEVVDEPRSPPVSAVERRYVKGYSRSHSLRDKRTVSDASRSQSQLRTESPSQAQSQLGTVALSSSTSDQDFSFKGRKVALRPSSDVALERPFVAPASGERPVTYVKVQNSIPFAENSQMMRVKDVGHSRSSSMACEHASLPSSSMELPRDTDENVLLSVDPEAISIPAEDAQLDIRSVDGDADHPFERFLSCPDDAETSKNSTNWTSPDKDTLFRAVSEALQPISNGDTRQSPCLRDYSDYPEKEVVDCVDSSVDSAELQEKTVPKENGSGTGMRLSLSLCGSELHEGMSEEQISTVFDSHQVSLAAFEANPNLVHDPNLLVCIDDRLVEFRVAAPYVMAALAYDVHLDLDELSALMRMSYGNALPQGSEESDLKHSAVASAADSGEQSSRRTFGNWFSWNRSKTVIGEPLLREEDLRALDGSEMTAIELSTDDVDDADVQNNVSTKIDEAMVSEALGSAIPRESQSLSKSENSEMTPSDAVEAVKPALEGAGKEGDAGQQDSVESVSSTPQVEVVDSDKLLEELNFIFDIESEYLSLVPSAEQLAELDLKPGPNTVRFTVESSLAEVSCRIFFWGPDSKIVISDVDGTITRSDVLGHLLPAVGRDWSHVGVAGLYSEIAKRGYKFMYLTARPIGQAGQTRGFLRDVVQSGSRLPNGPVLMSPNRLVESFTREVIRRKPQEFKISALREVRSLFPPDHNPFHAGFGNRETDVISYRAVGLIPQRIFVVNTQTELEVMNVRYESTASYSSLRELVDSVFPDIDGKVGRELVRNLTESAAFNSWNYWKTPLPDIDFEQLLRDGKA